MPRALSALVRPEALLRISGGALRHLFGGCWRWIFHVWRLILHIYTYTHPSQDPSTPLPAAAAAPLPPGSNNSVGGRQPWTQGRTRRRAPPSCRSPVTVGGLQRKRVGRGMRRSSGGSRRRDPRRRWRWAGVLFSWRAGSGARR